MCFPIESWRESRRVVYGGRLGPDLWKGTGRERNYFTLAAKGEDVGRRHPSAAAAAALRI
jgi:hypothetical protein